ncbi:unannotated protein [freshwater metagenome]
MAIPREQMGTIAGFMALISSISAVLGIAVMNAIAALKVTSIWLVVGADLPDVESLTDEVISGAIPEILASHGQEAADGAALAYTAGVTTSLMIASVGVAIAAIVSFFLLGSRGKTPKNAEHLVAQEPQKP